MAAPFVAGMASEQPSKEVNIDGVVKTHHLVRCHNFYIIATYRMYAEIIKKLHASNM